MNIDSAVQIDPMILLVVLVRLNLNQPMECLRDQSALVWINLNWKTIFTVTYPLLVTGTGQNHTPEKRFDFQKKF